MKDEDTGPLNDDDDLGTINAGNPNSTRSLSDLISNKAFYVAASGGHGDISYSFSVSLTDDY